MPTSTTTITGDQFEVYVDDTLVSGFETLSWPPFAPALKDVTAADTGATPLGQLVNGYTGELTLTTKYRSRAELNTFMSWLGTTGVVQVPAVGTFLPTVKVRVHNKNDADTLSDVTFLAVSFRLGPPTSDGADEATAVLIGKVCQDGAGNVIEHGYVAGP